MNCFSRPPRNRKVTFNNKVRCKIYIREESRKEKLIRLRDLHNEYQNGKINNDVVKLRELLKLIDEYKKNKCRNIK
jgi:hypothetical protein|tara:strand:- start:437 stop:664 length:228 start_codon:yes stop_codon:yes gene_type:complete